LGNENADAEQFKAILATEIIKALVNTGGRSQKNAGLESPLFCGLRVRGPVVVGAVGMWKSRSDFQAFAAIAV